MIDPTRVAADVVTTLLVAAVVAGAYWAGRHVWPSQSGLIPRAGAVLRILGVAAVIGLVPSGAVAGSVDPGKFLTAFFVVVIPALIGLCTSWRPLRPLEGLGAHQTTVNKYS